MNPSRQPAEVSELPPEGHHSLTPPLNRGLSKRQQQILLAASVGAPDKLIADQLGISPRTLEGHWRAIHRKLGSVNRCQAGFIFARTAGIHAAENPRVVSPSGICARA